MENKWREGHLAIRMVRPSSVKDGVAHMEPFKIGLEQDIAGLGRGNVENAISRQLFEFERFVGLDGMAVTHLPCRRRLFLLTLVRWLYWNWTAGHRNLSRGCGHVVNGR